MRLIDADSLVVNLTFSEQSAKWNVEELRAILQVINEMPTIKQAKWIPVSEQLPKNEDWVTVTILDESGDTPYRYTDFGWYMMQGHAWIVGNEVRNDIIAWMSKPKPYKGEEK